MTIYEANREIEEIENEINFLRELQELAFESTQPKAIRATDIIIKTNSKNKMYDKLDYSIDKIEPQIKVLTQRLRILKDYVNKYYKILETYDPDVKKIIILREEKKMTWQKISQACHYSEKACRYKYNEYRNGGKHI